MHLRSISLRDWKSYEVARFDFPAPKNGKNVILIGGQNGFGKTSLFEAIVLGLFGRDGLSLIARAPFGGTEERLSTSYREFIAKALHGAASQNGRTSCSVGLLFEDENGEPIELSRTWHFSANGQPRQGDMETVTIYRGEGRRTIGPTRTETDPAGWYRDWIAKHFLPSHLAAFFLFDGEEAARFAERDASTQVRQGIEGLLGLPWLRLLSDDLRRYAANRRGQVPGSIGETISRIQSEIDDIEGRLETAGSTIKEVRPQLEKLNEERSRLTRELQQFGGASQAQLGELMQSKERAAREIDACRDQLHQLVSKDLALSLNGKPLREKLVRTLDSEIVRERWQSTLEQGAGNLGRFVDALVDEASKIVPPLTIAQGEQIGELAKSVWHTLWHPAPENCAPEILHRYIRSNEKIQVVERIKTAERLSVSALNDLMSSISDHAAIARDVEARISAAQATGPELDVKARRVTELNSMISEMEKRLGAAEYQEKSLRPDLDQKRKELSRHSERLTGAAPAARRANRADQIASMLDELIAEAVPGQVRDIATEMTRALKEMAHRQDVLNRVAIDDQCAVSLYNSRGINLGDYDLSAGEKQIFTQALISAIVRVSGRIFPMIVDTPLGRLDQEHRMGILKHITSRDSQVVLVSTDTEVVDQYLAAVRRRVSKSYRLVSEEREDFRVTRALEGYFPGQEL